jgi:DNA invertase Pin-like site-specific DNA recombinase
MIYGYARVSTDGQSVDVPVRQFLTAGVTQAFRVIKSEPETDRGRPRRALGQLAVGP